MKLLGRRRKAAPKHAAPSGVAAPRRARRRDNTTVALIAVIVLTSGFVAGTTATFTASTRNGGNTFTVGAIFSPTSPVGSFSNVTSTFAWTNVDSVTYPVNSNVGYRVLRSPAVGPTDTAGSAPSCSAQTYTTLTYASSSPVTDSAFTANAGQYICYAAEGVYPCCPTTGKIPVITSLLGRIKVGIQTGYVAKTWSFNSGNANNQVDSGEKLIVNFNQDVSVASSITTSQKVCLDMLDKIILIGSATTVADTCVLEAQQLVVTATSGNFKLSYNGSGTSANIAYNATAATIQSTLQTGTPAMGAGNVFVTGPTVASNTRTWNIFFAGTLTGSRPTLVPSNGSPNLGCTSCTAARTVSELLNGATESNASGYLGYLTNSGTWSATATGCTSGCTLPARYPISAVAWSNCTVANVSCKTATITLGANSGSNTVTMPTGTWTYVPAAASAKSTSATGGLTLCSVNPSGSPSNGLCRPTASAGW